MPYEDATTIGTLNPLWPLGGDPKSEGDDHIRMLKRVLQGSGVAVADAVNRIVNPAMQISEEHGSTALTVIGQHAADQWIVGGQSGGFAFTLQRVASRTPRGSNHRLRLTVTTAQASLADLNGLMFQQAIEGNRVADFHYGAANALPVVLRFGWRSPAGTWTVKLGNGAQNRSYLAAFTVSASEAGQDIEKTFAIPGDVTGTWLTDNGVGVYLGISIGGGAGLVGVAGWQAGNLRTIAGATNGLATVANTFELFDVGLYLDAQASGLAPKWTLPDIGDALAACRRYFWRWDSAESQFSNLALAYYLNATTLLAVIRHPVRMRAAPVVSFSAANTFTPTTVTAISADVMTSDEARVNATVTGGVAKQAEFIGARSVLTTFVNFNARL